MVFKDLNEKYRPAVETIISNDGKCLINNPMCGACPFLNNECINDKFHRGDKNELLILAKDYVQQLNEKEMILDLERIKEDKLYIKIFCLACMHYNVNEVECTNYDSKTLKFYNDELNETVYLCNNGDTYHDYNMDISYTWNQKKIFDLLKPYWIEKEFEKININILITIN